MRQAYKVSNECRKQGTNITKNEVDMILEPNPTLRESKPDDLQILRGFLVNYPR